MILYFNASTDQKIVTDTGEQILLLDAKAFFLAGQVTDCNLSFQRLMANDFDVEATLAEYATMSDRQETEA